MADKLIHTDKTGPTLEQARPHSIHTLLEGWDSHALTILLIAPVLLTAWFFLGKQDVFPVIFGVSPSRDFASALYEYLTAFLLLFCVPLLILVLGFKRRPRDFGLQMGDWRAGLKLMAAIIPFGIVVIYLGSSNAGLQAEYPLAKSTLGNVGLFVLAEASYVAFYYLAWEFFFRGFMQFGLEEKYGALMAILVQTLPSVLMHITKPPSECFASILAGLIFGYVAWRTRSMVYPWIMHAVAGIATDLFVILRVM